MKTLPLYTGMKPAWSAVEREVPIDRDSLNPAGYDDQGRACDRCKLGASPNLRTPCLPAVGEPGGLLVVGEGPGKNEDTRGEPFVGPAGALLRTALQKHWKGPVAMDSATRCFPYGAKVTDKMVDQCRPFLAATLQEVQPSRILVVGAWSAYAVFGRSVPILSARRGFSFLHGRGNNPIPAFYVLSPAQALRNRFMRQWFDKDVEYALTADPPQDGGWGTKARIVETLADALEAEAELMTHDWATFDVETMGRMWTPDFKVIALSICGDGDEEVFTWGERALNDPIIRAPLARVLQSKRLGKVGSNVKYDQLSMRSAFGIVVRPIYGDTRLSRKLLDPEASGYLEHMAELVGMGGHKKDAESAMAESATKVKRTVRKLLRKTPPVPLPTPIVADLGFELHPSIDAALRVATDDTLDDVVDTYRFSMMSESNLLQYNARDVVVTQRMQHYVDRELAKRPTLARTWETLVRPAASALERVEGWGIAASKQAITGFDRYLVAREQKLKKDLDNYPDVNWDSPVQVRALLFGKLGLKPLYETASGAASTDKATLEHLRHLHPLPAALLDYRFVTKLRGTYASGMLDYVRSDGRIHPNVKLDGARSGRTSCVQPNLQNIPRAQTVEGKMARDCFIAGHEKLLLEVDYSQLELRIAAMLSGDEVMAEIFRSGVDYHLRTAQLVSHVAWGIPPEQVTDQHRSWAKAVNFGILYGKGAGTLAEEWGISKLKAQGIMDAIMGKFKKLDAWCKRQRAEAERTGVVWTWWNGLPARHRPLYRVADADDMTASVARNGAVNSPVQGTASDFCIASLVDTVQWIEDDGLENDVKLCLPVHDALLVEVSMGMVSEVAHTLHDIMTGHNSLGIPLEVDFKLGPAWGSMQTYKLGVGVVEKKK